MKGVLIIGTLIALIVSNEIFTLIVLTGWGLIGVYKLIKSAGEGGAL